MAVTGAIAAVAGLASGAYSSYEQSRAQKKGMKMQEQAQKESVAAAAAQQRRAAMEARKANAKKPDVPSILAAESARAMQGPSSTMLTGTSGTTKLGRTSLLGG